jgi:hypothetical protein
MRLNALEKSHEEERIRKLEKKLKLDPTSPSSTSQVLSKDYIAKNLWQNEGAMISDNIVKKVAKAQEHLDTQGYQLCGTPSDGNCFFHAFLGSYQELVETSSAHWSIPLLDQQQNKLQYLRDCIADLYASIPSNDLNTAAKIRKDGMWIHGNKEGDLLAKALNIPIRLLTINQEGDECATLDEVIFSDSDENMQIWDVLPENQRPSKYIFIVDLGSHFVFAKNKNK